MLPARTGRHNNQVGFVILSSLAYDLYTLTVEWVIGVIYRNSLLRNVGIMRLFPGSRKPVTASGDPVDGQQWLSLPGIFLSS
jgi:hypothetical protein